MTSIADNDRTAFIQRIAELEAQLAEAKRTSTADLVLKVAQQMDHGLFIWRLNRPDDPASLTAVYGNAIGPRYIGVDLQQHIGQSIEEIFPGALASGMPQRFTDILAAGVPCNMGKQRYQDETITGIFTMQAIPLDHQHLAVLFENISDQEIQVALAQNAMQEQQILHQQLALDALSTPLIPITQHVVVMPLIGSIDSRRAERILETLIHGVATMHATMVIVDITGVPIVDTHVANVLLQATQTVRLLGAQGIITGIRPEVAQTLVGLGLDLSGIVTHQSLQSAVAVALRQAGG